MSEKTPVAALRAPRALKLAPSAVSNASAGVDAPPASAVFSEALKTELRGTGVHSLTVYPGLNDTEMNRSGIESYGGPSLMTKLMPVGRPSV